MIFLQGLAIFLLAYAAILLFSGFAKIKLMIKLAKMKLGKDASDKKALRLITISGIGLLVAGIIVSLFAFGVIVL